MKSFLPIGTPNHVLHAFLELLGVLIVAYLRGICADNIENQVLNYQLDQDNPVPTSLDVYHSILDVDTRKNLKAIRGNGYRFIPKGGMFPTETIMLVVRNSGL